MKRLIQFVTACLICAVVTPAISGARGRPRVQRTRPVGNQGPLITGEAVERRVTQLNNSIDWITDFDDARKQAQSQNKPVFWMHALGDIEGET